MNSTDWLPLIQLLRDAGLEFEAGLTDAEVDQIENRFSFRFPIDLRSLLQTAVPFWNSPRWHTAAEADLRPWFDPPIEGILFDVERNEFWLREWGERPPALPDALKIARARINCAPKLIPILGHRYMPASPNEAGNPIFSVHQADIIYYGFDLEDYLRHEFNLPRKDWPAQVKQIDFWDPDRFQQLRWGDDLSPPADRAIADQSTLHPITASKLEANS
jgi:hypothetical protein